MSTGGRADGGTVGRWGVTGLLMLLSASPPVRQSARWRPDERALVSDFSYVVALAVSPFTVFAATTHGLTIYDRQARSWRLPVTSLDGYPPTRVRATLADGIDNAVWLGTDNGLARYDADLRTWEGGAVDGGVSNLMLDARDPTGGIFVQNLYGWKFVPRGQLVPITGRPLPPPDRRLQPLDVQTALNQAPAVDAMRALVLTDSRIRSHRFTAAARSTDRSDLFFGTDGMGVVRVDPATAEWEQLRFGLLAAHAGAVAPAPGGVWVASAGRGGERSGITWVAADLAADTAIEGPGVFGTRCVQGRRLLASGRSLWLACEHGVGKIEPGTYRSWLFDVDDPLSLAPAPDGVWVGSAHGLSVVTDAGDVVPVGQPRGGAPGLGAPVLSLVAAREGLWVGTAGGLSLLAPGANAVEGTPEVAREPALRGPILALALLRDTLVAITADQFAWRDPGARRWILARGPAELGRVTALATDRGAGAAWIGGTNGLAFWDIPRGTFRALQVPGDVPAPVRDVAVDPSYLWVATDSGLVRFARDAARR